MFNPFRQIQRELYKMAIALEGLAAEVARVTDIDAKAVALLQKIVLELEAIPASDDPVTQSRIDALTATLKSGTDSLETEVTKDSTA